MLKTIFSFYIWQDRARVCVVITIIPLSNIFTYYLWVKWLGASVFFLSMALLYPFSPDRKRICKHAQDQTER